MSCFCFYQTLYINWKCHINQQLIGQCLEKLLTITQYYFKVKDFINLVSVFIFRIEEPVFPCFLATRTV